MMKLVNRKQGEADAGGGGGGVRVACVVFVQREHACVEVHVQERVLLSLW